MLIKRKQLHFKHPVKIYIPVYQNDFDENGNLNAYSTFTYNYSEATEDYNMAASMNPDYILELNGEFDAITKPIELKDEE